MLMDVRGIPFTQYLMPDGRQQSVWIKRDERIEALAQEVIAAGWRFECEMLQTREISLTVSDGEEDVCIEVGPNGPEVPFAVDRLVISAHVALASTV